MQIIPTSAGSFDSFISSTKEDSSFADFFASVHDAINSMQEGENVSVSSALEEEQPAAAAPKVQSPYSRATTNGVTYTLDEVCFTKQELTQLRYDLVKAGAPETALKKLDALAGQPDGATLAQVMASLQTLDGAPQLSDDDKAQITSLLKKIDPSGVLDARVQQLMAEGKGEAALGTVYAFISQMDATTTLEVGATEALAFGRGLGLDTSSLQTLVNTFGGNSSANLLVGQFSTLMAPASGFFNEQKTAQKQLDTALQTTLQPLVSKARARTEKERQAAALRIKEAQQSKVLISKTVSKNSRQMLDETLNAAGNEGTSPVDAESALRQSDAISRKLDGSQSAGIGHAGSQEAKASADTGFSKVSSNRDQASNTQSATNRRSEDTPLTRATDERQNDTGRRHSSENRQDANGGTERDSSWNELTRKVETSPILTMRQDTQVAPSIMHNPNVVLEQTEAVAQPAPLARYVGQQVEQGLLSSSRNGTTRLDLQLHPQELGAITLSLSLRNGEVSATIRSEKTETAEIVTRQLDAIRANLEQQGLKVDKVEVQLSSHQQDENAWQNLDQHNSWQEEDARREELARLKQLSTMRNPTDNSDGTILEQPVHSSAHAARYATRSLNVVA
ncbi:MAG: flagellar hook-length control protein FliK [Desulfovibrio sp.]|uniref:flagellar hook-length control protein FliK n=1 Tax=Desulfovibrio sp. TaxID=885 RepID=UPI002A36D8D0|nr:flagellar hook-length control protein FliK [Desulfovibrio sp.]MDY0258569.1 flagellar hook-length control protein FliK [Desulfovibrio sp.]